MGNYLSVDPGLETKHRHGLDLCNLQVWCTLKWSSSRLKFVDGSATSFSEWSFFNYLVHITTIVTNWTELHRWIILSSKVFSSTGFEIGLTYSRWDNLRVMVKGTAACRIAFYLLIPLRMLMVCFRLVWVYVSATVNSASDSADGSEVRVCVLTWAPSQFLLSPWNNTNSFQGITNLSFVLQLPIYSIRKSFPGLRSELEYPSVNECWNLTLRKLSFQLHSQTPSVPSET